MSESLAGLGGLVGKLFPINIGFQFSKTEIGTLLLDVLLTEKISYKGKVTEYPVEDGSEMSDHIFAGSKTLLISGTSSNAEAYNFNLSSGKARLISVLETIDMLKQERKLITVTTALYRYVDYGIESIEASRSNNSPRDGNWIDVTAELRHVRKVTLRTADVPAAAAPASGRAGATAAPTSANANSANAAPVGTGTAAAPQSTARALLNGILGR